MFTLLLLFIIIIGIKQTGANLAVRCIDSSNRCDAPLSDSPTLTIMIPPNQVFGIVHCFYYCIAANWKDSSLVCWLVCSGFEFSRLLFPIPIWFRESSSRRDELRETPGYRTRCKWSDLLQDQPQDTPASCSSRPPLNNGRDWATKQSEPASGFPSYIHRARDRVAGS